jgi:peptide/nickel transport system permease protein
MVKGLLKSRIVYDYLREPPAVIGSIIIVAFIFAAILAPWIAPQNPYDLAEVTLDDFLKPPVWMEGGQASFLLGTDDQGRGILSTMLYGCRTSLTVALGVVLVAGIFGVAMGLLAGYYGGRLDALVMRIADTLFSFSYALIAFLLLGLFKQKGVLTVIVAISVADWVRYARTMRASTLEVKEEAYIMAAKATGASDLRLLMKHLFPNALPPILVVMAVDLAVVIMFEATLSFLGVGVPLTEPSLGMMVAIGKDYVFAGKWWLVVFPGSTLVILVVGINLFADWLREKLNPKIERGR